jgi:L-fuculose-phosphate aldolase
LSASCKRAWNADQKDREKRQSIIDACRSMNALGINQGTSGSISLRHGEGPLITPTSTP